MLIILGDYILCGVVAAELVWLQHSVVLHWVRKTSHATHTHKHTQRANKWNYRVWRLPFCSCNKQESLITFQHSSMALQIFFVSIQPIAFQHPTLSLCHLFFFTALLYESTPRWFTESTRVNQQGSSTESLRLNDQRESNTQSEAQWRK